MALRDMFVAKALSSYGHAFFALDQHVVVDFAWPTALYGNVEIYCILSRL